ncbi:MAG: HIT domain-containing protein [Candidatus Dependentiae bacterium]|nr:HIT domain-containing protein [Candidatus Dependentiae bacterium]
MDILYAPWRDKYINHSKKQSSSSDEACVFCEKNAEKDPDKQEFVLKKTKHAFIILNLYPYNGGHLLILPHKHVANLEDLSKAARAELMELVSASITIVKKVLNAEGINAGLNLGRASGAGIPGHLHFHVVPRWFGDTSFITTIGHTKNVSVDLERIYNDLKPAFQALEI